MEFRPILSATAACTLMVSLAVAQENYATWTYHKELTLNTTPAGVDLTEDVVGFPLLVRLRPGSGAEVVHFSAGRGADIRFTKADGVTRLPHQIDHWDSAAQVADIWVLLDTAKANATQTLRLYWGKAGAADSSNGRAVFDTAKGYTGVWHLGDAPGVAPRPNAITGRHAATPVSFAPGYFAKPGIAGRSDSLTGGQNFDSTSFLAINEGAESNLYNFPAGQFSYTVWGYPTSAENFVRLISLVSEEAGQDRIFLSFNNGNIIGRVWGTASHPTNSSVPPTLGEWNHFGMTVSRGPSQDTTRLYHNGIQIAESTHDPMADVARNYVRIGKDYINTTSDFTYNGRIDEARISHVTRSAAYMKLSYATQRPGATAVTQGAAVPATPTVPAPVTPLAPPSALTYPVTTATYHLDSLITTNTPTVTGTVDTFYVVPALPAGLVLNPVTGAISGTPTVAAPTRTYTVVAENASGSATQVLTLTVTTPVSLRGEGLAFRAGGFSGGRTFVLDPADMAGTTALTFAVHDVGGREIWSRTVAPARDGVRTVRWDGRTAAGSQAPAGVYLLRVKAVRDGKMVSLSERAVSIHTH